MLEREIRDIMQREANKNIENESDHDEAKCSPKVKCHACRSGSILPPLFKNQQLAKDGHDADRGEKLHHFDSALSPHRASAIFLACALRSLAVVLAHRFFTKATAVLSGFFFLDIALILFLRKHFRKALAFSS